MMPNPTPPVRLIDKVGFALALTVFLLTLLFVAHQMAGGHHGL